MRLRHNGLATAMAAGLTGMMNTASKPKQRRDAVATKARILAAATQCFSEVGYAGTGIRDIAAAAGVSYTLLGLYFGSKAGLLEAAIIDSLELEPFLASMPRAEFGERLARLVARNLDGKQPTAMTILAAADPIAGAIATRVVRNQVIKPLADWIGEPYARERAVALTMLGGGFVIYSQQLPLLGEPLGFDHPIVRWLARSFQDIVDNPDGWKTVPNMLPGLLADIADKD